MAATGFGMIVLPIMFYNQVLVGAVLACLYLQGIAYLLPPQRP